MKIYTWEEIESLVIKQWSRRPFSKVWGIPRGGVHIAQILEKYSLAQIVDDIKDCDLVVDDLVESGATKKRYENLGYEVWCPIIKEDSSDWIVFPWEKDEEPVADNLERLNQYYKFTDQDFNKIKEIINNYEN